MCNIHIIFHSGFYNSNVQKNGDPAIGYPQISVRTNRKPQRSDLNAIIEKANEFADRYSGNKEERGKAVIEALTSIFGGGSFGHSWIEVFHSDREGDYTSYAYHEKYGFVRNGNASDCNDRPDRGFSVQRIIAIDQDTIAAIEESIIPSLNAKSTLIGSAMGIQPAPGHSGVYTPITNCTWFAGYLWNAITDDSIIFTQKFNGKDYAKRWGIDALYLVNEIADPGMMAESLNGAGEK